MLISNICMLDANRSLGYCWQTIRRFQNVDFVTDFLRNLHQIPTQHAHNAKKQAIQIRQCLIQGAEYFSAARNVSIATKPVLYYYAVMSFALAEILIKQDGESSLDSARETNKHHGLQFVVTCLNDQKAPLISSAASLSASPAQSGKNQRYGTFELWHRSARQLPVVAVSHNVYSFGAGTIGVRAIVKPDDRREFLNGSISLLDCIRLLPGLELFLYERQIEPLLVRGFAKECIHHQNSRPIRDQIQLILHPSSPGLMDDVMKEISVEARGIDDFSFSIAGGALFVNLTMDLTSPIGFRIPSAYSLTAKDTYFISKSLALNELGLYYVSLFILGNFARYYPDIWMKDVEASSELAVVAHEICELVERRVPLLCVSEISRQFLIEKTT